MQPPQIDNQARLQALLAPQENVQEALVVDLSHDLRFSPSSLVLTDTRLHQAQQATGARRWDMAPLLEEDLFLICARDRGEGPGHPRGRQLPEPSPSPSWCKSR